VKFQDSVGVGVGVDGNVVALEKENDGKVLDWLDGTKLVALENENEGTMLDWLDGTKLVALENWNAI